jgi:hypothetical protein
VALRDGRLTRYSPEGKNIVEVTADAEYEELCRDALRWGELPVAEALQALRQLRPA